MRTVIADASFCGSWFLLDEMSEKADALLISICNGEILLTIPSLWYYEIGNLLRSAIIRNRISKSDAIKAFSLIEELPINNFDTPTESMAEILRLSQKHKLSFYDASYLELADRLKACLFTSDKALEKAVRSLKLNPID